MADMAEAVEVSEDDFEVRVGGRKVRSGLNAFEAEMFLDGFARCAEIYGKPVPDRRVKWTQ